MKRKMFLMFFLTGFFALFSYAQENSYRVDDGFVLGIGILRDGKHLSVGISFAVECFFESNTPIYEQRNYAGNVMDDLEICLRNYASNIYIPQFKSDNLSFNQTEFYNGFLNYISENGNIDLNKIHITRLEIKKRHE